MIFCKSPINPKGQFSSLNSGNFFIKNTGKAKQFLNDVFTVDLAFVRNWWKPEYGVFTNADQDAIFYLLHCDSEYSDDNFFVILDHHYFNSRPFNFSQSFKEYFLCHFPGGEKEKQIKEFARRFKLNKALMPLYFRSVLKNIIKRG